ncbi:integrase, catalytic region [Verminephrobacter eiseniae EF01-2]|uniref:Integrase, catalytic region n=2 Tax=Verminephrobacter eiseniae TaxID=364317 RepID=A1WKW5_VEREI|nr:integrase, catalytic region [Verminephrobacter eiseniae EF01-2]MCW5283858.1 integrase [Verminephrobacter eiseniae]MCW5301568.1 integrase [Verminephrobacter eiseniae]MCW8181695.1 integrase [Verminephrobacter eiseniae]MCW8189842.1 integrase [Verminephrobacter eiseniae]
MSLSGRLGSIIFRMVIDMDESRLQTISQLQAFLAGTLEVRFCVPDSDDARYAHIVAVAVRLDYAKLKRPDKGVVLRYLQRTSGYSRAQLTRLLMRVVHGASLHKRYRSPAHAFARRYTPGDTVVLAEVDRAHGTLSGPATVHLLGRAWAGGDARFERLARLSVSHLYNLRASKVYKAQRVSVNKTRPVAHPIGLRRAPSPQGRPGFIRIDSVHQGDLDGTKGVYHINAVDIVTQWEVLACCERISQAYLLPALEALIEQFPFVILGLHSDNGSEYINKVVAESKNASVVRKTFGYSHIPQRLAARIDTFCREHLNPYVNLHRLSMFAKEIVDTKGKVRKTYPHDMVQTPLEKLASLADAQQYLRPGITIEDLQAKAAQISDLDAANAMNVARSKLFDLFNRRPKEAA